jgi:hypothetical protein
VSVVHGAWRGITPKGKPICGAVGTGTSNMLEVSCLDCVQAWAASPHSDGWGSREHRNFIALKIISLRAAGESVTAEDVWIEGYR